MKRRIIGLFVAPLAGVVLLGLIFLGISIFTTYPNNINGKVTSVNTVVIQLIYVYVVSCLGILSDIIFFSRFNIKSKIAYLWASKDLGILLGVSGFLYLLSIGLTGIYDVHFAQLYKLFGSLINKLIRGNVFIIFVSYCIFIIQFIIVGILLSAANYLFYWYIAVKESKDKALQIDATS